MSSFAPLSASGTRASLTRRNFLRQSLAAPCFLIPILRNGTLGQPVLASHPWFVNVADTSGLAAFRNTCGDPAKDYLVETLGCGVALFDYNHDGLIDVLLVNGSSFKLLSNPNLPQSLKPFVSQQRRWQLHGCHRGKRTDQSGMGSGRHRWRLRQRRPPRRIHQQFRQQCIVPQQRQWDFYECHEGCGFGRR